MKFDLIAATGEGFSITIISQQIREMFEAEGHEVEWEADNLRTFKHLHKSIVINTQPNALVRMLLEPFTVSPRLILNILLSNWEEHSTWVRKAYLSAILEGKNGSTPMLFIVHSKHSYEVMIQDARSWFAPSAVQHIARSLIVEEFGIDARFKSTGQNDPDKLIVPYNRIVQSQKNLDLHVKVSRLYSVLSAQLGRPVKSHEFLHAPAYDPEKIDPEKDIGRDIYTFRPQFSTRDATAEGLRQYGMFLSTSMFESFGIYYLELLNSGVVGVFLDRPWVRRLLPDYRYIVKSEDLVPMMTHVRENYLYAQEYLKTTVIPQIEDRYSLTRFMDRVKTEAYTKARPEKESQ